MSESEKPKPEELPAGNPPPNNPPTANVHEGQVSALTSIINSSTSFISLASQEWFNFLIDQPVSPPFEFDAKFADESTRSARLVAIVVVLSIIVIGGAGLIDFLKEGTIETIKGSLMVLMGAFLIALLYIPFAYVFGVRINCSDTGSKKPLSLRQVLFSVLYTCVPWIPVFAFLRIAIVPAEGTLLILLLLAAWVCCFYVIYNFAKGIIIITRCRWYTIFLSLVMPFLILALYVLFR